MKIHPVVAVLAVALAVAGCFVLLIPSGIARLALGVIGFALLAVASWRYPVQARPVFMTRATAAERLAATERCATCGYYTYPAACRCVVAARREAAELRHH